MIKTLHLGLSYKCNMKCRHCFVKKSIDNVNLENLYTAIDYLYDNGLIMVFYTHGEPLLAETFYSVSNYLKGMGVVQVLLTNGWFINENSLIKLKENNIYKVNVSLDSVYPKKHDYGRNVTDAYTKAIEALRRLVENGFDTGISFTISNENFSEVMEIVKLSKNMNINRISFLRERKDGKIIQIFSEKEYLEAVKKAVNMKGDINLFFHDYTLIPLFKQMANDKSLSEVELERYIEMNLCHSKYSVSIAPNGDVYNCNLCGSMIGNINKQNIREIVERNSFEKYSLYGCADTKVFINR